jgi:hypothetical protein
VYTQPQSFDLAGCIFSSGSRLRPRKAQFSPYGAIQNLESPAFQGHLCGTRRPGLTLAAPARELSGNLGYCGFIVQLKQGAGTESIHIQTGTVQISRGTTKVYANDKDRRLERWLLNTGKPQMKNEVFEMVEREIR